MNGIRKVIFFGKLYKLK